MATKAAWSGQVPANSPQGAATGIQLNAGDEISVVAYGWIKYGKEEYALAAPRGRVRSGLETKDEIVLKARIGASGQSYNIGNGVCNWAAPEAGELHLYVADKPDGYGDNSGEFQVEVKKTTGDVKKVWPKEGEGVPANQPEGVRTVDVTAGEKISILAHGWVQYGKEEYALAAPFGRVRAGLTTRNEVVLKARIAGKSYDIGGGVIEWEAPATGELSLYVVDKADGYGDNKGAFKVEIYK